MSTLVDPWPEHVEFMRKHGLHLSGMTPRIVILNPVFHQPALYSCDGRTVKPRENSLKPRCFP